MLDYIYYEGNRTDYLILLHGLGGNSQIFYKQLNDYKKDFNVLAIHLPGHGNSPDTKDYGSMFTYDAVVKEINDTMDHLNIQSAHFVGISLGSIIIHHLLQKTPYRVKSAVLGGAITRFNIQSKMLLTLGRMVKNVTPYMWLYAIFAQIIMPKSNHKRSRNIFISEAKKMKRENFLDWFHVIRHVRKTYQTVPQVMVPKLYISGREDRLFINNLEQDIKADANAQLVILEKCGHVCNIEKADDFNSVSKVFLLQHRDHVDLGAKARMN